MKLRKLATLVCSEGKPLSPQITKKNGLGLGGPELASATPISRGPFGVRATSGPPLSPEQTDRLILRLMTWPLNRLNTAPARPPESQIAQDGSGQNRTRTSAAVRSPIFSRPRMGSRLPKPAT